MCEYFSRNICVKCKDNNKTLGDILLNCDICESCPICTIKYICSTCDIKQCDKCLSSETIELAHKAYVETFPGSYYMMIECDICKKWEQLKLLNKKKDITAMINFHVLSKKGCGSKAKLLVECYNNMINEVKRLNNVIQNMESFIPPCEKCGYEKGEYEKLKNDFYNKAKN